MIAIPEKLAIKHLQENLKKGDVLFWENFKGKESIKDCYFVLLSNFIDGYFICARATSRTDIYKNCHKQRLMNDIVFIRKGESKYFTVDSILDLSWSRKFTCSDLSKLLGVGITKIGSLEQVILERINYDVEGSITLSEEDRNIILRS